MKFKCQKCGYEKLEEIMINVTQSTSIAGVDENGILMYGENSTDHGDISHYQCMGCGDVIKDERGFDIISTEGLVEWLKKRKMV